MAQDIAASFSELQQAVATALEMQGIKQEAQAAFAAAAANADAANAIVETLRSDLNGLLASVLPPAASRVTVSR
jgi:hypothetical protein